MMTPACCNKNHDEDCTKMTVTAIAVSRHWHWWMATPFGGSHWWGCEWDIYIIYVIILPLLLTQILCWLKVPFVLHVTDKQHDTARRMKKKVDNYKLNCMIVGVLNFLRQLKQCHPSWCIQDLIHFVIGMTTYSHIPSGHVGTQGTGTGCIMIVFGPDLAQINPAKGYLILMGRESSNGYCCSKEWRIHQAVANGR
jgi:hypothetical protein